MRDKLKERSFPEEFQVVTTREGFDCHFRSVPHSFVNGPKCYKLLGFYLYYYVLYIYHLPPEPI